MSCTTFFDFSAALFEESIPLEWRLFAMRLKVPIFKHKRLGQPRKKLVANKERLRHAMQNHCNFKAAPPALNLHHHLQKMPQPIHYLFCWYVTWTKCYYLIHHYHWLDTFSQLKNIFQLIIPKRHWNLLDERSLRGSVRGKRNYLQRCIL